MSYSSKRGMKQVDTAKKKCQPPSVVSLIEARKETILSITKALTM